MANTRTINGRAVLTTGQVAEICHVAPRTVSKWFDAGRLGGYRIPGSRDRRIPVEQLLAFMQAHGIPADALDGGTCRVLIVDPSNQAGEIVNELNHSDRYDVRVASTDFEAGVLAQELAPHVIVLDADTDVHGTGQFIRKVRTTATLRSAKLVAVVENLTPQIREELLSEGFDACLARPFAAGELLDAVEKATDLIT